MRTFIQFAGCTLAVTALLSGCSDPKAASKDNFKAALQQYYDAHPDCASRSFTLPAEVEASQTFGRRDMDALANAGLLTATQFQKTEPAGFGGKTQNATYIRYQVTDAGAKAIHKGANSFLGGTDVCFARRNIDAIGTFTEPADMMGVRASRVSYTYSLKDIASWAKDPAIQEAFPEIKRALAASTAEATDGLVLTNDGWKQEHELR